MAENPRARRLADRIKEIVASMLDTKIKDPRLGFVTITDVRVTSDLQNAAIFYTVLGDDEARKRTAAALESAKGMLRSEVGKQTGVRLTPALTFHLDAVPQTAAVITDALHEAQRRDAEVAALRVGKSFADGEDPYRKPRTADLDSEDSFADAETTAAPTRSRVGLGAGASDVDLLDDGGFDPLEDDDENLDAPDEYRKLDDFDSLDDAENAPDTKVDGYLDTAGGPHPRDLDESQ